MGGMTGAGAGVNLPALRRHNAALVLDLLRAAGAEGISRLELAERTGLTPQAVSKITARLRAEGLAGGAGLRAPPAASRVRCSGWSPTRSSPSASTWTATAAPPSWSTSPGWSVGVATAPLDFGAPAGEVLADAADAVRDLSAAEPHKPVLESASPYPARSTTGTAYCTGSPASRSGTATRCATRWRSGSGCRSSSTRTPTPPPWPFRRGRRPATSRTCTSVRGWAPGW
ncbi:hypothetical protein SVIOM74S_02271 [Streptomyces violarus]